MSSEKQSAVSGEVAVKGFDRNDAYSFAKKLIRKAAKGIVLVDGYCDDVTLDLFAKKRKGVKEAA